MNILFCCPDYFGFYKVIEKGIQDNLNTNVKTIVFTDYKYKSIFQKIKNFIYKTFFKINLKKTLASKEYLNSIAENDTFDFMFIICPDFFTKEDLEYLIKKAKYSAVYYWDSFDNIPRYTKTMSLFDASYSFEPKDVEKYNLNFLTNFHHVSKIHPEPTNDVYFIGSYDERFEVILNILNYLKSKEKSSKIYIQTSKKKVLKQNQNKGITFINKPISIDESEKLFQNSKIILDVQKKIQNGLTFRVFEAMGNRKKLITTNTDIINYDFYNPNNIFVWRDDTQEIPESFFETNYQELPEEIFKKYSL
ncbi:MAG TPA: hypothetical protein VJU52_02205, partial [Flavobacterium sp.]|nr:hypothetical protein [Flavobacterium sp.]